MAMGYRCDRCTAWYVEESGGHYNGVHVTVKRLAVGSVGSVCTQQDLCNRCHEDYQAWVREGFKRTDPTVL
jgi:hypothetical protein